MTDTPHLTFNDGNSLPQVGFGLWQVPEDTTANTVKDALGLGYRLLDGAAIYGNEVGQGEGFAASGLAREDVFITTKVWNTRHGYDSTREAVEESLGRLKLSHLDLCLIHWPCPNQNKYVETWKALIDLRDEGRIRSIGVSNFNTDHLERIIDETGVTPALNQIELHPHLQQDELRATHARLGIVTQSWTPLGQSRSFDEQVITDLATKHKRTPAQIVLRWHTQLGLAVIPRSTNLGRMAQNLDLFGFELSEADMAAIATLNTNTRVGPDPLEFE